MRRIRKFRKELWGYDWPEVNNMFAQIHYWPKPKYMKWESFDKKRNTINHLESKYWKIQAASMEKTYGSFMDGIG
jgi:hypothetical protein